MKKINNPKIIIGGEEVSYTVNELSIFSEKDVRLKKLIISSVIDSVTNFIYYDRKEDEDLPRGSIENALEMEVISIDEIVETFKIELMRQFYLDD